VEGVVFFREELESGRKTEDSRKKVGRGGEKEGGEGSGGGGDGGRGVGGRGSFKFPIGAQL